MIDSYAFGDSRLQTLVVKNAKQIHEIAFQNFERASLIHV